MHVLTSSDGYTTVAQLHWFLPHCIGQYCLCNEGYWWFEHKCRYIPGSWLASLVAAIWSPCYIILHCLDWNNPWYGTSLLPIRTWMVLVSSCLTLFPYRPLYMPSKVGSLISQAYVIFFQQNFKKILLVLSLPRWLLCCIAYSFPSIAILPSKLICRIVF